MCLGLFIRLPLFPLVSTSIRIILKRKMIPIFKLNDLDGSETSLKPNTKSPTGRSHHFNSPNLIRSTPGNSPRTTTFSHFHYRPPTDDKVRGCLLYRRITRNLTHSDSMWTLHLWNNLNPLSPANTFSNHQQGP